MDDSLSATPSQADAAPVATAAELSRSEPPPIAEPPDAGPAGVRALVVFHLADVTGPAKSLRPRLEALVGHGGSLEVVAPGEGTLRAAYEAHADVRTLAFEPLTVPRGPLAAVRALGRLRHEVARFRRELRRARPELVIVVTAVLPAALIAARLERLPTILYVGEIFAKGHVDGRLRALGGRLTARLSERLADRLVCCSETVAAQFGHRPGKVVTVYPGISSVYAHGDRAAFRARHDLAQASPLVAVVGNVSAGRAQDTAVRALAIIRNRLPGARLVIAGSPHPRPVDEAFAADVFDLVRELGLESSVAFAGFVDRVADVYAAADVVVNPARFNEPFGRVALEALMAERPVVASAVGAIPEVLRHGRDALLVPRDDPVALAEAVIALVDSPGLRDRLVGEGSRRVRSEFGEDVGIEAFERVISDVLEQRSNGAHGPEPPAGVSVK